MPTSVSESDVTVATVTEFFISEIDNGRNWIGRVRGSRGNIQ